MILRDSKNIAHVLPILSGLQIRDLGVIFHKKSLERGDFQEPKTDVKQMKIDLIDYVFCATLLVWFFVPLYL